MSHGGGVAAVASDGATVAAITSVPGLSFGRWRRGSIGHGSSHAGVGDKLGKEKETWLKKVVVVQRVGRTAPKKFFHQFCKYQFSPNRFLKKLFWFGSVGSSSVTKSTKNRFKKI